MFILYFCGKYLAMKKNYTYDSLPMYERKRFPTFEQYCKFYELTDDDLIILRDKKFLKYLPSDIYKQINFKDSVRNDSEVPSQDNSEKSSHKTSITQAAVRDTERSIAKTIPAQIVNRSSKNLDTYESAGTVDDNVRHTSLLRHITFNMDEDLYTRLRIYCVYSGMKMSDVINKGVKCILKDVDFRKISDDFLGKIY